MGNWNEFTRPFDPNTYPKSDTEENQRLKDDIVSLIRFIHEHNPELVWKGIVFDRALSDFTLKELTK